MVSIDIERLFTNVPVGEAIGIAKDNVYVNNEVAPRYLEVTVTRGSNVLMTCVCINPSYNNHILSTKI